MLVTCVNTVVTPGPMVGGVVLGVYNKPGVQLDLATEEANRLRQLRAAYAVSSDLDPPPRPLRPPPGGGPGVWTTEPGIYYVPQLPTW